MLNLSGKAEVRAVSLRKEFHGDTKVKALTLSLHFRAVPLDVVEKGFVAQLSLVYGKADDPKISDIDHYPVSRHVSNVLANIGGVVLQPIIVDNVKLTPLANRVVDVKLKLKGIIESGVDDLHGHLMETVDVELTEREFVAEVQQEAQLEAA